MQRNSKVVWNIFGICKPAMTVNMFLWYCYAVTDYFLIQYLDNCRISDGLTDPCWPLPLSSQTLFVRKPVWRRPFTEAQNSCLFLRILLRMVLLVCSRRQSNELFFKIGFKIGQSNEQTHETSCFLQKWV